MNKEETRKAIEVMEAWLDDEIIECHSDFQDDWYELEEASWNWKDCDYRVKPHGRELWVDEVSTSVRECKESPGVGWIKVREVID